MPIRWDKFTLKAQEAVQRANEVASEHANPELLPLHVLVALLEDREGIVPPVLEKIGIGPQGALSETYREIERLPKVSGGGAAQATLSKVANDLLEWALQQNPSLTIDRDKFSHVESTGVGIPRVDLHDLNSTIDVAFLSLLRDLIVHPEKIESSLAPEKFT